MIELKSIDAYNILAILDGGVILSKSGAITVCFFLQNPAAYTLGKDELEYRNEELFRAFKHMGNNTFIHKQDVFLRKKFDSSIIEGDSYIQRAEREHNAHKYYYEHYSILAYTISNLGSLKEAYVKNPLSYKDSLSKSDKERLSVFLDDIQTSIAIINSLKNTSLTQLDEADIKYYIFNYVNGLYEDEVLRDINFSNEIQIGDKKGKIFSICRITYLPDSVSPAIKDDTLPVANSELYSSMLEKLGVHLKASHVVNQVWEFNSEYITDFSARVKEFGRNRDWNKSIAFDYEQLSELEGELVNEGKNVICRTHFNIILLEEEAYFKKANDYIKNVLKVSGITYYEPTNQRLGDMYLGTIIGNVNALKNDYTFKIDLPSSLCLALNASTYKHDSEGIFFSERLYNTPYRVDTWYKPLGVRIPARNSIYIASTGGGKSVLANNDVQQKIESNYKLIVVEFGSSFKQLTQLYPEKSLHIDYDGTEPLGINPFAVVKGAEIISYSDSGTEKINIEKLNTLVNIVLKYWREKQTIEDTTQVVSLRAIILEYYRTYKDNYSFPHFYQFVKDNIENLYIKLEIEREYFNIKSFLHNCKEFLPGGIYENICKESELGTVIHKKDFVVFELTKIKKDPFLISVIMSILFDTVESKLLDKSTRGGLYLDEYAETQTLKDMFNDNSIHSSVAFFYQKLRKDNAFVTTIIQSPAQLPKNEYTDGIVANTQLLYVLPTTESVYSDVVDTFKIKVDNHINLMKSMRNNFEGDENNRYSEVYLRIMDLHACVLRLQMSPEKLMAFQTDGDIWQSIQNEYKQIGSIEEAIDKQLNKKSHEKNTHTIRL